MSFGEAHPIGVTSSSTRTRPIADRRKSVPAIDHRSSRFPAWAVSTIGTPGEKPRNDPPEPVRISVQGNTRIRP